MSKINSLLPGILPKLEIIYLPIRNFELQITVHLDGHFYKAHQDSDGKKTADRQISFVYYFHQIPKGFTGGDLLLFDTDLKKNVHSLIEFSRIKSVNNSIIFFPSAYYHKVTQVICKKNSFCNGRFTLNGWISGA